MPGPVVTVRTTELPSATGVSINTGTLFVTGKASYGPEVPTKVAGLSEAVALFGPRTESESQELYDYLNTFFATGGARAYVQRELGASAEPGKLELEAGATAKTLVVTSKYKGTYANSLKIRVKENEGKTASKLEILNSESEVLEASPEYAKASEIFEWGKTHEAYVLVTEGSGYAAGKGSVLKVLVATKLAGGVNPTVTETTCKTALAAFPKVLGPGQLGCADGTNGVKEAVHTAMGEAAQAGNRIALCDLKEAAKASTTVATLTAEKGTYTATLSQYMVFTASNCTVQGVTLGTTRSVPGSAVAAGLCARVSQTSNDNQNPSGREWSLAPYVLGFVNSYKQTEIEELSTAGINAFREEQGIPSLYGFVTACSKEKDIIYWQASPSRERMALQAQAEAIGAGYLFKTISNRLIARFQGELQGLGAKHQATGALFGETPAEACLVNTGEPVNTPTTKANGELNAEMLVRIAPYANIVGIVLVSVPISEAV